MIIKVMLEDLPRHGPGPGDELRRVGNDIQRNAQEQLADRDGATPIAYPWARKVRCESPNCGAEIPLMRSFWLCKMPKRKLAIRYNVKRTAGTRPLVTFEIFKPMHAPEVRPNGDTGHSNLRLLWCHSASRQGSSAAVPTERGRHAARGATLVKVRQTRGHAC